MQTGRLGALNRLIFISTEHDVQNEINIIAIINFLIIIMLVIKMSRRDPLWTPSLKNYATTASALAGLPRLIVSPAAILAALMANLA